MPFAAGRAPHKGPPCYKEWNDGAILKGGDDVGVRYPAEIPLQRNLTDGNITCLFVDEHGNALLEISLGSQCLLMNRNKEFDGRAGSLPLHLRLLT